MPSENSHASHADLTLEQVLQQLQAAAAQPFSQAGPIPGAVNHSKAFLAHESERVFKQEWVCVGRVDEVANAGDYLTCDIADVPVLVVRQVDGGIDAFVNACAHRFACLMPEEKGCVKRFVCRYHAWSYNLDGSLNKAPHIDMKPGFEPNQYGLRPLQIEIWQGFIYVTLAATVGKSVAQRLAPLTEQVVGRYDMDCYKTILRETIVWDANWKNLIENFTESYHVPVAHKKTFAQHKKPLADYVMGDDYDYFGYHRAPQTADTGAGAAHPNNHRLDGEWRRMMVDCCVFPSHLITLMPDYLWYISVQPEGTDQMRATWGVAIAPENLADISATDYEAWVAEHRRYIEVANSEDKVLVEALHRGSLSPLLPKGVLHPLERNLWQFTRYLARITQPLKAKSSPLSD